MWTPLGTAINKTMQNLMTETSTNYYTKLKEESMIFKRHNGTDMPKEAKGKLITIKTRGGQTFLGKCEEFFWLWGVPNAPINAKNILEYYIHDSTVDSMKKEQEAFCGIGSIMRGAAINIFPTNRESYITSEGRTYYSATAKEVASMMDNNLKTICNLETKLSQLKKEKDLLETEKLCTNIFDGNKRNTYEWEGVVYSGLKPYEHFCLCAEMKMWRVRAEMAETSLRNRVFPPSYAEHYNCPPLNSYEHFQLAREMRLSCKANSEKAREIEKLKEINFDSQKAYKELKESKESKFDPWFKPIHEIFFNVYVNNIKLHPTLESAKDGKSGGGGEGEIKTYKIDIKALFEKGQILSSTRINSIE